MNIKTVTVVGANGALGVGVSSMFASFGDAKVYMVSRTEEKSIAAIEDAAKQVRANSIKKNMIPKTYADLNKCVAESDFIIETIVEDMETKMHVHKLINESMNRNAISSSITSGLSINSLSEAYSDENKDRFLGVHFFNPPYVMRLVELIPSEFTQSKVTSDLKEYLESKLLRRCIIAKDSAAFLANRIGFYSINVAITLAEKYKEKGGVDYIDYVLGGYTGRAMSPIKTADFVGLDTSKAIIDNIYNNSDDSFKSEFKTAKYFDLLIEEGKMGAKQGVGFYKNKDEVYDIYKNEYRKIDNYYVEDIEKINKFFANGQYELGVEIIKKSKIEELEVCRAFLISYIVYSLYISKNVAENIADCDIAMAEGFNWIPPISLLNLLGKEYVKTYAVDTMKLDKKMIDEIIENDLVSKYEYNQFLRARR